MRESSVISVHAQDMLGGGRKTFSIARGSKWLSVGSNPKIGRDVDAMFSENQTYACKYANQGAAKRIVKILEGRGVVGLEVKETPKPNPMSEQDLLELIEEV